MSNYSIDIFSSGKENSIETSANILRATHSWLPSNNYLLEHTLWKTYEAPDYNFIINTFNQNNVYDTQFTYATRTLKLRIECAEERRGFFIKIPNTINLDGTTDAIKTESLILCCAHQNGTLYPINCPDFSTGANTTLTYYYQNSEPYSADTTIDRTRAARLFVLSPANLTEYVYEKLTGDTVAGNTNHHNLSAEEKTDVYNKLLAILNGVTYSLSEKTIDIQDFRSFRDGNQYLINDFGMLGTETDNLVTYDMLPLPIFDYTQTADILKYINTGDKSGALDVFDIKNPEEKIITDYKTNFRVFLSAYENDRTKTHYTVVAYNSQYISGDDFNAEYEMNVYEGRQTGQPLAKLGSAKDKKYPTLSYYNKLTPGVLYTNFMNFQDTTNEVGSNEKSSGYFGVTFTGKDNSAVKATVGSVTWSQSADGSGQQLSKTNIVDGYRYTAPSGEYLEVIFRAIDLKDLNDGYAGDPDNEDDQTGTDADFIAGGGYNTFLIDSAQFKTINDSLWSTDWSTVFKSNTIDPIKCVIGCKSIPFNANASSSAEIVIANLYTGVSANTVKPMKSISAGSVLMPSFRKDFTDINLCKVHLYLPFIGWTDLPAAEVMSRAPYNDVGVEARPKRLAFKYLIDFVDGNCRCVVSVNGTERWYFDGNCAVDIPLTSDNHTGAISAAIRNGAAALLSVGAAVASYASSNAVGVVGGVLGAAQNAANTVPTYDYHASCSPSGYIEASMNNHIMIIIERPNIKLSDNFAHKVGRPCGLTMNLGSLHGFTKCTEVNLTGVNGTPEELAQIKAALERGVYL